jgi:hypothetical protein
MHDYLFVLISARKIPNGVFLWFSLFVFAGLSKHRSFEWSESIISVSCNSFLEHFYRFTIIFQASTNNDYAFINKIDWFLKIF